MELERRENESALQHHKRLIYGKLEDKILSDIDYAELSEYVYGQPYSSDVCRRMMYGSKRTLDLITDDAERQAADMVQTDEDNDAGWTMTAASTAGKVLDDIDARRIAFEKEKQKFYDQRMAYNKMIRDRSREEEINEIIRDCIQKSNLPKLEFEGVLYPEGHSTLLVSLNDIHYGANIDNAWRRYNSRICAHMFEEYLEKALRIANVHGCEDCVVWAAGDVISGNIHRNIQVTNKENVIEQVMGASELIAEFLAELSRNFKTVRFVSVAGNHSRIEPNKDNAIHGERLDNLVEWYLAARLQNFDNIIITDEYKMDDTISVFEVRGKIYVLCHGDFDGSYTKVQSLQTMVQQPVYAILSGHRHHNQTDVAQGVRTVMAGSFQGMDDFCVEKRIYGKPEQMICVCDETGIVCHYDIELDD